MELDPIYNVLVALVGFPALLAAAINLAKYFGLPDGYAPKVSFYAWIVAFLGVAIAIVTGNLDVVYLVDERLATYAKILVSITAFAVEFGLTKWYHELMKGAPLIGFSQEK